MAEDAQNPRQLIPIFKEGEEAEKWWGSGGQWSPFAQDSPEALQGHAK